MSEWAVDYNVPGGTDNEGWQYAADFPVYVTALTVLTQKQMNTRFVFLQDISWAQNYQRLCQAEEMDKVRTLPHFD